MKIHLVCIEDGLENVGFRKLSGYVRSINPDTKAAYVPTGNIYSIINIMREEGAGTLRDEDINAVGKFLGESDIAGICSMTQYSALSKKIIAATKRFNPRTYIIWGGIHAIIHPEDAIKHVDAVCTGEGEFAFKTFLNSYENGKDFTTTPSFWFRKDDKIIKNANLPLMSPKQMDELPNLMYQDGELIYRRGKGFGKIKASDYLNYNGLQYATIWSVGCPLMCTYCGNSKFIEYDNGYRRVRHSSPQTIIDEIKRAKIKQPYLSTVIFSDDSFMALPYKVIEEFSKLYKEQIKIPFVVGGVIPNYVREDKIALLVDAGMNRVRMGIQSGSENILKFYKRPTKLHRIKEATEILGKFRKYMIPPAYDIILENPVESKDDTRATVDMIYKMPRPFTLNLYALRVIPNTIMAQDVKDRGLKVPPIDKSYYIDYHRTIGNIIVFALTFWKFPKWLYKILRAKIYPVQEKQKTYPILFWLTRMTYLVTRAYSHVRFMDFSLLPGKVGYVLWKFGIIRFWQRFMLARFDLSKFIKKNKFQNTQDTVASSSYIEDTPAVSSPYIQNTSAPSSGKKDLELN